MNTKILEKVEILWSDPHIVTVDEKLAQFEELKKLVTKDDLPELIELLKSDKNDFWTRELLGEIVVDLNGVDYLDDLLEAFEKNKLDGHDNDTFQTL